MTITLSDIAGATSAYLRDEVNVRIKDVTSNLNPGESGTFTLRIRNAPAPVGVPLREVAIHLTSSDDSVAQLKAVQGVFLVSRATGDANDPLLPRDELVAEMFVFLVQPDTEPNATFDAGEAQEFSFPYRAAGAGTAQFTAHIHASIDVADLLPRTRSSDIEEPVTVLP